MKKTKRMNQIEEKVKILWRRIPSRSARKSRKIELVVHSTIKTI